MTDFCFLTETVSVRFDIFVLIPGHYVMRMNWFTLTAAYIMYEINLNIIVSDMRIASKKYL